MRYAYFPGCVARDRWRELDDATREVAQDLGIELVGLDGTACCGGENLQVVDSEAQLVANARTLSMAQARGLDILTVCGTCQFHLARAARALEDPQTRERVNKALEQSGGSRYEGGLQVKHLLEVLLREVGERKLAAHVRRPLNDIEVGAFYGCRILQAPGTESFDTPKDPTSIERLITVLGGDPLRYRARTACCGFDAPQTTRDLTSRMSAAALQDAKGAGAAVLATPCPLCHQVLDGHQSDASKVAGERIGMPVLHLSQLVGLAFGIDPERLGLQRHHVSVSPVIRTLENQEVVKA